MTWRSDGFRATRKRTAPDISTKRRMARSRRHFRLRKKVNGTPERPRLVVHRCSRHIIVQLIDDLAGHTLAVGVLHGGRRAGAGRRQEGPAAKVGQLIAARRARPGVTAVVFDRGGYAYHGRIAALADAAREGGLEF